MSSVRTSDRPDPVAAPAPTTDMRLEVVVVPVSDVDRARDELVERGVDVSETFHDAGGVFHHAGGRARVAGPDPARGSYRSFASFTDLDGNTWVLQEIIDRLPGR